ncbi:MAG: hypothetical protein AAF441_25440 [Pseudomonadota bacterium]
MRGALVVSQTVNAAGVIMPGSLKQISLFLVLVFLMTTALLAQLILRSGGCMRRSRPSPLQPWNKTRRLKRRTGPPKLACLI